MNSQTLQGGYGSLLKNVKYRYLPIVRTLTFAVHGCMNEDENAKRLRLPGISNATEDVIAARDIFLAH